MPGRKYKMVYPGGTEFPKMVSDVSEPSAVLMGSGQFTANIMGYPIASPKTSGKIAGIYLSVGGSGRDDSNPLSVEGDVFINGVSCLTTKPKIEGENGSAAAQKTTVITGDDGITQAVINEAANTYTPGDVITGDLALVRTSSPTTEINTPIMVVELEPDH